MDLNSASSEKEIWKGKTAYNQIQKEILLAWFKHYPHLDKVTMERLAQEIGVLASKIKNWFKNHRWKKKLANQIGIQESRILRWFQNQNSLNPEQRRELLNLPVESTHERPDETLQQQQQHINLSTLPCEVCVSQGPSVIAKQPTQATEGGESSDFPLTFMDHLLKLLTPGENSDTQAPSCCQYQEKCQNGKEYSDTGALQGANHSQPHPEQEQEFPDPGHSDIVYITQWWDKGRQALIAEWEPLEGTPRGW
ncbi:double homeobox protein B-like [Fukomys damarensis]|uniref:double homeobox protein B-like n=1 Tax=Fukomys damarensis TaxID=885580 RepID=UPI0014556EA5|nr:double homeobox protein B-like [Fukomys damarensis]